MSKKKFEIGDLAVIKRGHFKDKTVIIKGDDSCLWSKDKRTMYDTYYFDPDKDRMRMAGSYYSYQLDIPTDEGKLLWILSN